MYIELLFVVATFILTALIYKKTALIKKELSFVNIYQNFIHKNNIFEKFREHLQIVSVIKNGIEIDIELDKLDKKSLKGSLEDITANIKKIESEIKDLENRLYK